MARRRQPVTVARAAGLVRRASRRLPIGRRHALPPGLTVEAPSCVTYLRSWLADAEDAALRAELTATLPWEQPWVTVYGRRHLVPRQAAWFGAHPYTYSGTTHQPQPWTPALDAVRRRLTADWGVSFDSCLVNRYRDGRDSMGAHADDEPELGPRPVIASLSLGARRRFVLRARDGSARYHWELGAGDLLVMHGDSQQRYMHALPKTTRVVGERINLTFRRFTPRPVTRRA